MPELAKLLLNPELPADLKKVFYEPRGNFWHKTITLTFVSLLYSLPLSWYAHIYPSYTTWRQMCPVHRSFLTGLQVNSMLYKIPVESGQLLSCPFWAQQVCVRQGNQGRTSKHRHEAVLLSLPRAHEQPCISAARV